jgi:hypothetical protein
MVQCDYQFPEMHVTVTYVDFERRCPQVRQNTWATGVTWHEAQDILFPVSTPVLRWEALVRTAVPWIAGNFLCSFLRAGTEPVACDAGPPQTAHSARCGRLYRGTGLMALRVPCGKCH